MRLLFITAVGCCAVLVMAAGALWWNIRSERSTAEPPHRPFAEAMRRARHQPHPRMDLAAGVAAGILNGQRPVNARRRGLALDPAAEAEVAKTADNKSAHSGRRDWAYYNENMGDLSDPDSRRAPAGGVRRPLGTVSVPESR